MLRRRRAHFLRCERGATLLEFAIVALPLFLLIFGIIEIGLIFWAGYELENATAAAARLIRTGQAQNSGWSVAQLQAQLCQNVVILSNCTSSVQLNVQTFSTFGGICSPIPSIRTARFERIFPTRPARPARSSS